MFIRRKILTNLVRDKVDAESVVESRKQYVEALRSDAQELLAELCSAKPSSKQEFYELMSDFDELYHCLRTQLLTTGSETGTKARHMKQYEVAKKRAEDLGGYFNGLLGGDE